MERAAAIDVAKAVAAANGIDHKEFYERLSRNFVLVQPASVLIQEQFGD